MPTHAEENLAVFAKQNEEPSNYSRGKCTENPVQKVTIHAAIQHAFCHHPYVSFLTQAKEALANQKSKADSQVFKNPELRINNLGGAKPNDSADAALRFYFPRPWEIRILNQVAINSGKMAASEQKKELLAFIFEIKKAFFRASFADVFKRDGLQIGALLRELKNQIEIQYKNKELLLPDYRDFSLEIELISAETFKAHSAATYARSKLQKISSYLVKAELEFPPVEDELRQWIEKQTQRQTLGYEKSPEVQSLGEEREWIERKLKYFKSKRFPWFGFLEVGYPLDELSTLQGWEFQVALELPLFNVEKRNIQLHQAMLSKNHTEIAVVQHRLNELKKSRAKDVAAVLPVLSKLESGSAQAFVSIVNEAKTMLGKTSPKKIVNILDRAMKLRAAYLNALEALALEALKMEYEIDE